MSKKYQNALLMEEAVYKAIENIYGEINTICVFLSPIKFYTWNMYDVERKRFIDVYIGLVAPNSNIDKKDTLQYNSRTIIYIYDIDYFRELLFSSYIYSILPLYGSYYSNPMYKNEIDNLVSYKLLIPTCNTEFIEALKQSILTIYKKYKIQESTLLYIEICRLYDFLYQYSNDKIINHYIDIFNKDNLKKYINDDRDISVEDIESLKDISSVSTTDNEAKFIRDKISMIISNIKFINSYGWR